MDKTTDPRHLDIRAFALAGAQLQGQSPLSQWPRLLGEQVAGAQAQEPMVRWHLSGRAVPVVGGPARLGMTLRAELGLPMQCQRCLGPVVEHVHAEREFLVVADEATAEALVEDELILALPLVPRHDTCPQDLPQQAADEDFEAASERPNPFAALAALKKED